RYADEALGGGYVIYNADSRTTATATGAGEVRARLVDGGRDLLRRLGRQRGDETVPRLTVRDCDLRERLTGLERGPQVRLGDADVRRGGGEDVRRAEGPVGREDRDVARELRDDGVGAGRRERCGRDPACEQECDAARDEHLVDVLHVGFLSRSG